MFRAINYSFYSFRAINYSFYSFKFSDFITLVKGLTRTDISSLNSSELLLDLSDESGLRLQDMETVLMQRCVWGQCRAQESGEQSLSGGNLEKQRQSPDRNQESQRRANSD